MAVNSLLLDFKIDPVELNGNEVGDLFKNFENVMTKHLKNFKKVDSFSVHKALVRVYEWDSTASTAILKIYSNGLITLNMEYMITEDDHKEVTFETCKSIEKEILQQIVDMRRSFTFVPVKRGTFIKYFPTSDDRLLEYDIDALVFEERSPFQKVQIVHSKSLGNMLVLDDVQNISEADLIYTETLMSKGKEHYKDKEILILGGGDGALLYELLKEDPKEVIMLEIDEVVMKACAKYMRSICGDVLDRRSGPNYKIVLGDCMKLLQEYIKEGRKFDYIFGDLTDVPICDTPSGEIWDFINKVLNISFKLLKKNGKFMTHLIGSASTDALKMYESQLFKAHPNSEFKKTHAYVPSFLEDWVFGQISLKDN